MGVGQLFTGTMEVLKRSLDVRLQKHSLTVSNIANAEVPGYKLKDISFKDAMRQATEGTGVELARTSQRHFPGLDTALSFHVVDSNQDIDQEMAGLAENNLMYQASVQLLAKKFEGIKTLLNEGGR